MWLPSSNVRLRSVHFSCVIINWKIFFYILNEPLIFPFLLAKRLYSWIWNQNVPWSSNIFRFGCLDVCYLTNLHKIPWMSPFCVWTWMVGPCSASLSAQAVTCILRVCRCLKIFNEKHKIVLKWIFIKILSLPSPTCERWFFLVSSLVAFTPDICSWEPLYSASTVGRGFRAFP